MNAPWTTAKQSEMLDLHKIRSGKANTDEQVRYDELGRERDAVVQRGGLVAVRNAEFWALRERGGYIP